jgi:XRE family aerobic/anaerobic benzoate catabolism transcriptional regulator
MTKSTLCSLVAKRVRFHRNDLGLSRRILAQQTDISERYLAQLEAGKANISLLLLERIANALGVALPDLVKPHKASGITPALSTYLASLDTNAQTEALEYLQARESVHT